MHFQLKQYSGKGVEIVSWEVENVPFSYIGIHVVRDQILNVSVALNLWVWVGN